MRTIICPKCKAKSGLHKDYQCKTRWACEKCGECCVVEKKNKRTIEEIENEILELETDQHPLYHKNESEGITKMAELLKELNTIKTKI